MPEIWDERPAMRRAIEAFAAANGLLDAHRLRIWDKEGLTVTQLRLLLWVNEQEGLSNADLADRLLVTRPSVSALLDRLERGGFIRREISPNDRRGIAIWLEDRGRQAVASLRQEGWEYLARLMECMTDEELDAMASALSRFAEAGRIRRKQDLAEAEEQEK
jgi:DNA-binding MarR family transcriptional regulator